jgi:hypothetical protein
MFVVYHNSPQTNLIIILLHTVVAMVKVINKSQQRLHSKSVATVSTTRSGDVLNTYDVIDTREVIDNCDVIDTCDVLRTFIVIQQSRNTEF